MSGIRHVLPADDGAAADHETKRVPDSGYTPASTAAAQHVDEHCRSYTSPDDHDEWNAGARGETPLQRVDRAYGEILQEVRVAQTGVQILFAFLLTLAFTSRFASITPLERNIYVLTLMLCAGATALLIAPAAFHRVVYRRRLKQRLVQVANLLALSGLALLLLAMVSALLLILDVVLGWGPALLLALSALSWFVTWWFVLPVWSRIRHQACAGPAMRAEGFRGRHQRAKRAPGLPPAGTPPPPAGTGSWRPADSTHAHGKPPSR